MLAPGVVDHHCGRSMYSRIALESATIGGNSPVDEMHMNLDGTRVGPDTWNPV